MPAIMVIVLSDEYLVQKNAALTRWVVVEYAKHSVPLTLVESARLKAVRIQTCTTTATGGGLFLRQKQHLSTETVAAQRFRDK